MDPSDFRFRQIHLDFHTSQYIDGIAADFDPEEFAATLVRAHVNSITCFARCHHGYLYYDTKTHPERRHPHLHRNLLADQIAACHARGIRVPIYTTIQWDRLTASEHPDWLTMDADGAIHDNPPNGPGFYAFLCVNSPYRDFLKAHVADIFDVLPAVDGFFFDIVQVPDCSCHHCRAKMLAAGVDPAEAQARQRFALDTINEFKRDLSAFVRKLGPDATLFYNAGHIGPRHGPVADAYTHFEIESLPGGGWGYVHFPLAMRYARTVKQECLAHTGKFHTSWGDFHSLRNPAALQFECFRALALGSKCAIGDQLHPRGRIEKATYDLIGPIYEEVEKKEPWCRGGRPVAEIGVMSPEEFTDERIPESASGAVRMLQEANHQFDMLSSASDFSLYQVIILPDEIPVNDTLRAKLQQHLAKGGGLLASYRSGLNPASDAFALPELGVEFRGDAPFSPDFIRAEAALGKGLPSSELVMYLKGVEVKAAPGSEVLAQALVPYFNRAGDHFCSHQHTPSSGKVGYPGVVRKGNAIYFMHPLFTQYAKRAPRWCKQLFLNALDLLLPEPLVRVQAPSTLLSSLNEQPDHNRWVLHLLHYVPERRGSELDTIEDVIPLYDLPISLRAPRPVSRVQCVPDGAVLPHSERAGRVEFVLPKLMGHQMLAIEFAR